MQNHADTEKEEKAKWIKRVHGVAKIIHSLPQSKHFEEGSVMTQSMRMTRADDYMLNKYPILKQGSYLNAEKRASRLGLIGGSEAGVILGLKPFNTTQYDLYKLKMLQSNEVFVSDAMMKGNIFEPFIREKCQNEFAPIIASFAGHEDRVRTPIISVLNEYNDSKQPGLIPSYMGGNPDDILRINGKNYLVDYKYSAGGEKDKDDPIRLSYEAQVVWYAVKASMECHDVPIDAGMVIYFDGISLDIQPIDFDSPRIQRLAEQLVNEAAFFYESMLKGVNPFENKSPILLPGYSPRENEVNYLKGLYSAIGSRLDELGKEEEEEVKNSEQAKIAVVEQKSIKTPLLSITPVADLSAKKSIEAEDLLKQKGFELDRLAPSVDDISPPSTWSAVSELAGERVCQLMQEAMLASAPQRLDTKAMLARITDLAREGDPDALKYLIESAAARKSPANKKSDFYLQGVESFAAMCSDEVITHKDAQASLPIAPKT